MTPIYKTFAVCSFIGVWLIIIMNIAFIYYPLSIMKDKILYTANDIQTIVLLVENVTNQAETTACSLANILPWMTTSICTSIPFCYLNGTSHCVANLTFPMYPMSHNR